MWGRFRYHHSKKEWEDRHDVIAPKKKKYMSTPLYKIALRRPSGDLVPLIPKFYRNKFGGYDVGYTMYDWYISPSFKKEESARNRVNKLKEYYKEHSNRRFWSKSDEWVLVYLNGNNISGSLKALNIKVPNDFIWQNGKFAKNPALK